MTRRSSIRPTRSCGSTPRRSAAPTCTSSRATCPRRRPARSSATRPSARCRRSAPSVTTVAPGDRVLMSCVSSCGRCRFCKEGRYGQCLGGGGWIFGHLIDGLQAEYARVPFADNSVYKVPERAHRRAGPVPRRHPADLLRGRRAQRHGLAGRCRGDRRRRPDRPGGDPHREAVHARADRRDRPRRQPPGERPAVRRGHDDQQRPRGRRSQR